MCIALLEVGVLHFAVYLTDRRRRPYLWFALQNAWACGYALMVTGALQVPLGAYDGPVTAASVCIALLMTVQFLHAHFKLGPPHWAWPVATAIAVIGCVATPNPLTWQPVWAALVVVMLVAVVVYQLVSCARLALRASPPSGLGFMVAAWASLGFGGGADALAWLGIADPLEGARGACPALVIFALMQALMLSRDHLGALKDGDRLNTELCSKVLALEHGGLQLDRLNAELQRQIVDRSRQLFAALTLVGNGEVQVELNPGDIVQGRYRVVAKIGEGGMGVVHEVRRLNDDARLALKVATRVAGAGLARLAREAELAATLQHENIVRVVDVDVASAGFLFIVMEFVDGHTLAELIKRGLPLAEACTILADTAAGMAALHEASIVHRDLKPANVMVARVEGRLVARLMDFGISGVVGAPADRAPEIDDSSDSSKATKTTLLAAFRPVLGGLTTAELIAQQSAALSENDQADDDDDDDDENEPAEPVTTVTVRRTRTGSSTSRSVKLTEFGHVIGTPLYMAPERGKIGDDYAPSADVFAFGVVAYEVLTGALPFAESPALLVIAGTPVPAPAPLTTRCPALPGQLAEILDRCLAQDPAVRPTANALALALTARGDLEAV